MSLLRKMNYIFSTKQKVQSVILCIALFIGALLELAGVSLIAELVKLIGDPETIHTTDTLLNYHWVPRKIIVDD